jgi:hypothetical protein
MNTETVNVLPYTFNNLGRLGNDATDASQKTMFNTRLANYNLANYFASSSNDNYIHFATNQPALMYNGTGKGVGVNSAFVDNESYLMLNVKNERPLEKLSLNTRTFVSVPYLGKGSCDPLLESQLQQGELGLNKKTNNNISENVYSNYTFSPKPKQEDNVKYDIIEENAMNGWVHGGINSRELFSNGGTERNVNLNFKYL